MLKNPPPDSSTSRFNTEQIDDREIYCSNLSEGVVVRLDARPRPARLERLEVEAAKCWETCTGQSRQDTPLRLMLNCFHNKLSSGMWIHPGSPHPWLHHCQCTLCKFGKMGLAIHNYTGMNSVWHGIIALDPDTSHSLSPYKTMGQSVKLFIRSKHYTLHITRRSSLGSDCTSK